MKELTSKRQRLEVMRKELEQERSSFISHWRDLADYILPRRIRLNTTDNNRGDKKNQKIVDSTATTSARVLRSGLMSGITSPARPWFKLTTNDHELADFGPVKEWLHTVSNRMNAVFTKSNLYKVLPTLYGDLGVFGTAAVGIEEDFDQTIRFFPFAVGSYCISNDSNLRVNVFQREMRYTVRQVVEKFGAMKNGKADWSPFSHFVKDSYEKGNYEAWVDVCQFVVPNQHYNLIKAGPKFKKFSSIYYEKGSCSSDSSYLKGGDEAKCLRDKGFDFFPVMAPRWETTGEDVYGTDCPGMIALGDIKQLQLGERRGSQAIEKMVNPPMKAPAALASSRAAIGPGDITYLPNGQTDAFSPAHETNLRIDFLENKQEQIRKRIQRVFYEDLFLMLATDPNGERTAFEISERKEEKLLALGPVLEQLNQDLLDPTIDNTFSVMFQQGQIPPPPREIAGQSLKVEYISIMAQAQKMVGIGGLERFTGYIDGLAKTDPAVWKKVNRNNMIDAYADMTSIAPNIVRPNEEVEKMEAAEAAAQEVAARTEQAQIMAGTAKQLSETSLGNDSALDQLLSQAQAGAVA
jgi:hypothetical protein